MSLYLEVSGQGDNIVIKTNRLTALHLGEALDILARRKSNPLIGDLAFNIFTFLNRTERKPAPPTTEPGEM